MKNATMIKIGKRTAKAIKKHGIYPQESYDSILIRTLKISPHKLKGVGR